jgi:mono/diheme cytochrome c family protein
MKKCITLVVIGAICACSEPPEPTSDAFEANLASSTAHDPVPLSPAQRKGRLIYETMCWTCHGQAGRGDGPAVTAGSVGTPPSFHTVDFTGATAERLRRRFAAALTDADDSHPHMQYVAALLMPERFIEALSFIPALGYPAEIPGSALAGERIYGFRCVGCHGETGKGDGRAAASLTEMPPADFTTDTLIASGDWDAVYGRVREGGRAVHGSSMPPWGTVFSEAETWDLVAYIATFQPGLLGAPPWIE